MCGISGIVSWKGEARHDDISRMNDLIRHRGPDAEGFFVEGNVALGHRRLSIIDLSDAGKQPMCFYNCWIVFNGEIYNYIELREELIDLGYKFSTSTDTEVILAAYDRWGAGCLDRFNGMWAFAIYDTKQRKLFVSRDRFGVKPFYYSNTADAFVFGSEIKQILQILGKAELNEKVMLEFALTYVDNHTDETYFRNVNSLLPGHFAVVDVEGGSIEMTRWYELKPAKQTFANESDGINAVSNILRDSINLRLRSDVKLGACLSGGLDSSSINAIASNIFERNSGNKLTAIHAQSIQKDTDESKYAQTVAAHFPIELLTIKPSTEDFKSSIDEVIYTQEEPFSTPSIFMSYFVFQKAKQQGCTVMLNGQGGDEVLLGYERYFSSILFSKKFPAFVKQIFHQYRNSALTLPQALLNFFYFTNISLRKKRLLKRSLIKKEFKRRVNFETLAESCKSFKNITQLQLLEISKLQLPHLLRYEDRNSMRNSIETRLPFLDYRLVETALVLAPELKIRDGWTKFVLRKVVDNILPASIVWRKSKLGFNAPDSIWLDETRPAMLEEIKQSKIIEKYFEKEAILKNFPSLSVKDRWIYFNIAAWERIYNVTIPKS